MNCVYDLVLLNALIKGDVDKVKQMYAKYNYAVKLTAASHIFDMGIRYGHVDVVKYAMTLKKQSMGVDSAKCVAIGTVAMVEFLYGHEMWKDDGSSDVFIKSVMDEAAMRGNVDVLQWFFEHGHVRCSSGCIPREVDDLDYDNMVKVVSLYHQYQVDGAYKFDCPECCTMCTQITMQNLWEMDTRKFENGVQWLPREMLIDTLQLAQVNGTTYSFERYANNYLDYFDC